MKSLDMSDVKVMCTDRIFASGTNGGMILEGMTAHTFAEKEGRIKLRHSGRRRHRESGGVWWSLVESDGAWWSPVESGALC